MGPGRGRCREGKYFCSVSKRVFVGDWGGERHEEQRLACECPLTGAWEEGRAAVVVPMVSLALLQPISIFFTFNFYSKRFTNKHPAFEKKESRG